MLRPCAALALALPAAAGPPAEERRIPEAEMRDWLRDAAARALGPDLEVRAVHYRGDLRVRGEPLAVEVERPPGARPSGRLALRATLRTRSERRAIGFVAEVAPGAAAVRRGASVLVIARSGLVTVSAGGQAQQDGAPGERIHVLCPALHRVLVGRVIDASTVEVDSGGR